MSFAERLNSLIDNNNITQYKLAKDTGIAQSQLSNWRSGSKLPSFESLATLSTYFNISIDYLVTGKECSHIELSPQEEKLIQQFRYLLPYDQLDICEIVEMKYNREKGRNSQLSDSGATA